MTDASLILVATTQGMVLGIVAFDFYYRWLDRKERELLKIELTSAQAALADLHNKNTEIMRGLQDKVQAHGMAISMRGK